MVNCQRQSRRILELGAHWPKQKKLMAVHNKVRRDASHLHQSKAENPARTMTFAHWSCSHWPWQTATAPLGAMVILVSDVWGSKTSRDTSTLLWPRTETRYWPQRPNDSLSCCLCWWHFGGVVTHPTEWSICWQNHGLLQLQTFVRMKKKWTEVKEVEDADDDLCVGGLVLFPRQLVVVTFGQRERERECVCVCVCVSDTSYQGLRENQLSKHWLGFSAFVSQFVAKKLRR